MKGLSMVRSHLLLVLLSTLILAIFPSLGWAQDVREINPSIRAAGMGNSASSAFWGGDPNYWVNPALLAYHEGLRFERGRTRIVPDLADNVWFTSKRVTLAAYGMGVSLEGWPIEDLGGSHLSFGELADLGDFEPTEENHAVGVGISAIHLLDSLLRTRGKDLSWRRFGDVSGGVRKSETNLDWCSGPCTEVMGKEYKGTCTSWDQGLLVRLTPWNSIDFTGWSPEIAEALAPLGGILLEGSYAKSVQNYREATVTMAGSTDYLDKFETEGWSVHTALGLPPALRSALEEIGLPWLADGITPLVSFGYTADRMQRIYGDLEQTVKGSKEDYTGWELTFANVLTIRRGHIKDPDGERDGNTEGTGIGFRVGRWGSFRYDTATIPQALGLEELERTGFTIQMDPIAIWGSIR